LSTKQRQILLLEESNLANATKKEYGYRLKQFFRDSTITSYEELLKVPNEETIKTNNKYGSKPMSSIIDSTMWIFYLILDRINELIDSPVTWSVIQKS